ncbi:hypothetical protein HHK36_026163 [Tetracentron sinense]|uniref:Uncharacterized protein n=1 Tax=Tetracentron sinense TaxID=13715 RepID=A0A834YMX2_TETSI|nr:hypothetical protein HHK36_026163 [Tetracentron sinense]
MNLVSPQNTGDQKVVSTRAKVGRALKKIADIEGAEDLWFSPSSTDSSRSDGDGEEPSQEGGPIMLDEALDLLGRRWDRINGAQALKLLPRETKLQLLWTGPLMSEAAGIEMLGQIRCCYRNGVISPEEKTDSALVDVEVAGGGCSSVAKGDLGKKRREGIAILVSPNEIGREGNKGEMDLGFKHGLRFGHLGFGARVLNTGEWAVKKLCCKTVKSLFADEGKHGGEATVEAVQLIADYVRTRACQLHPDSIEAKKSEGLQFAQESSRRGEAVGARSDIPSEDCTSLPGRKIGDFTRMDSGEGSRPLKKNQKRNMRRRRLRRERNFQPVGRLSEDSVESPNREVARRGLKVGGVDSGFGLRDSLVGGPGSESGGIRNPVRCVRAGSSGVDGLVEGSGPLVWAGRAQDVLSGQDPFVLKASGEPEPLKGVGGSLSAQAAQELRRSSSRLHFIESGNKRIPVAASVELQCDQEALGQGEEDHCSWDLRNLSNGEEQRVAEGELALPHRAAFEAEVNPDLVTPVHDVREASEEGGGRVSPALGVDGQLGVGHRAVLQEPLNGRFWVEGSGGLELEHYTPLVFGDLEVEPKVRWLNAEGPVSTNLGHVVVGEVLGSHSDKPRALQSQIGGVAQKQGKEFSSLAVSFCGREAVADILESPPGLREEGKEQGAQHSGSSSILVPREKQGGASQGPELNCSILGRQKPLLPIMTPGEVSGWVVANVEAVGVELGVSTDGQDSAVRSLYRQIEGSPVKDKSGPNER